MQIFIFYSNKKDLEFYLTKKKVIDYVFVKCSSM